MAGMIRKQSFPPYAIMLALVAILAFMAFAGCSQNTESAPINGFDLQGSDPKAVEIADQAIEALGGKENWDNTRYIVWDWFGKQLNVWDKWTGNYRFASRVSLITINLHTKKGRAWKYGHEATGEELDMLLEYGVEAWSKNSYWLFAPYKMKDPGVTLKYLREDTTRDGRLVDIISMTFNNVGLTPNNKYHMYIDKESKLVTYWAYFMDASDTEPRFTAELNDYQKYGNILIADSPGPDGPNPRKTHKNIMVFETLPDSVFTTAARIDWESIKKEYK